MPGSTGESQQPEEGFAKRLNRSAKAKVFGNEAVDLEEDQSWFVMAQNTIIEKGLATAGFDALAKERKEKRKRNKVGKAGGAQSDGEVSQGNKGMEGLNLEQQKLAKQLKKAKEAVNTTEQMKETGDIAEAIVSIIPELGDVGASVALGVYYAHLGRSIGMDKEPKADRNKGYLKKIAKKLAWDVAAGAIPILGDIADFCYQACAKIAEIFKEYYENLAKDMKGKLPDDIIASIDKDEKYDQKVVEKLKKGKLDDIKKDAEQGGGAGDVATDQVEEVPAPSADIVDIPEVAEITASLPGTDAAT